MGGACGAQKVGHDIRVTHGGASDLSIDSFANADNGYMDPALSGPMVECRTFISSDMSHLHGGPFRVAEGGENATTAGLFEPRHMDTSVSGTACRVCVFVKGFMKVGTTNMKGYGTLSECSSNEGHACGCRQGMMPTK